MKKTLAVLFAAASMSLGLFTGAAQAAPVTECGQVTESGVVVGDNAEGCYSEPPEPFSETVPVPVPVVEEPTPAPAETPVFIREELAYTGVNAPVLAMGSVLILVGLALFIYGRRNRGKHVAL